MSADFIYFESTEGGMEFFHVFKVGDMTQVRAWMSAETKEEDEALVEWMKTAEIGDLFEHRMGTMVRLKNIKDTTLEDVMHKSDDPRRAPECSKPSCTRPALYYGPIGGYGKLCQECADHKNALARAARKRLKEQRGY